MGNAFYTLLHFFKVDQMSISFTYSLLTLPQRYANNLWRHAKCQHCVLFCKFRFITQLSPCRTRL